MYEPERLSAALTPVLGEVRAWFTEPMPTSAEERASWLAGLRQLIDATEAQFTQVLAAFDATRDGETLHAACSTSSWLQGATTSAALTPRPEFTWHATHAKN